ncbi:MAG: metalloregulator ArsR/SmtB family transcription factor [Anaerolineae bacterium]|jgi:DNA-binding transcriptional ArsR family regulator
MEETQQLLWDCGTAYDLFISLEVLHEPSHFDVRGSWAAGVRARLPNPQREMLKAGRKLFHVPFHWIYDLPTPKDGTTVLWTLSQIPAAERLPTLTYSPHLPAGVVEHLQAVTASGTWNEGDREAIKDVYSCSEGAKSPSDKELVEILDWWSRAEEFGDRYLEALRAYHDVFFAQEEKRIGPALEAALARAKEMAEQLSLADLVEELSQGLRFDSLPEVARVALVPSYWSTPLMFFGNAREDLKLFLFGARPADASLVPGEVVPDGLLRVLKALSDPTRLRIMHYLANDTLAPAELARRLRLRPPTVTHHLKKLRLAGLVRVTVGEEKDSRQYAARLEAVTAAYHSLQDFLHRGAAPEDQ